MAFNVGISFGTAVGGAVVSGVGIAYVGAVGAVFSLVAWALTLVTIKLARWGAPSSISTAPDAGIGANIAQGGEQPVKTVPYE